MNHTVTFLPRKIRVSVPDGATVLQAQILAGLDPDAPCGGKGTCGKCKVEIEKEVLLAGAFGNYMDPASACHIGMIPPALRERIIPIGNAAGEGAKACALSREAFEYAKALAAETEFLELASLPEFQDRFVDALEFAEEDDHDL